MNNFDPYFIVDGIYENVLYEIEKELFGSQVRLDDSTPERMCSKAYAEIICNLLIDLKMDSGDKNGYLQGFLTPGKRYYLKINLSLLKGLAEMVAAVLSVIAAAISPETTGISLTITALTGSAGVCTFKDIMQEVPKEHFCAMLCAHQNKSTHYISTESIFKHLTSDKCPYLQLYKNAYGHFCENRDRYGKCCLRKEDITDSLRELGKKYDIIEEQEGTLFKIN